MNIFLSSSVYFILELILICLVYILKFIIPERLNIRIDSMPKKFSIKRSSYNKTLNIVVNCLIPVFCITSFYINFRYFLSASLFVSLISTASVVIAFLVVFKIENRLADRFSYIKSPGLLLLFILLAPIFLFTHGNGLAHKIIDGEYYDFINSSYNDKLSKLTKTDESQHIKYLGCAGENIFFLLPDRSTITTNLDFLEYLPVTFKKKSK